MINAWYPWEDMGHCHNCWDFESDHLCDEELVLVLPSLPDRDSTPLLLFLYQSALKPYLR